jgi:hypothetical protein
MSWYVNRGGTVVGPFEERSIRQRIADGNITPEHTLSEDPNGDWHSLEDSIFASASVAPSHRVEQKRTGRGALGRTVWFALFLGMVGLGLSSSARYGVGALRELRQQESRQLGSVLREMISVAEGASSQALPAPAATTTEVGRLGGFVRRIMARRLEVIREYEVELEAIGWMRVLDSERLRKDPSLTETRAMVQSAKASAAKVRAQLDADVAQVRRDMATLHVSEQMLAGMRTGFERGVSRQQQFWTLEEAILAHMDEAVKLLESKRGRWELKADHIEFRSKIDLEVFDAHMSEIRAAAAQEEKLQVAFRQELQETLRELEK